MVAPWCAPDLKAHGSAGAGPFPSRLANRKTRLAFVPSKSAQADSEPRHSEAESFSSVPEQRARRWPI
jgi:hypothetical protein